MRRNLVAAVALLAVAVALPVARPVAADAADTGRPTLTKSGWLPTLNFYRATAGLRPVSEDPSLSQAAWLHSRYMAKNRVIGHSESSSRPWYSSAGDAAARSGNVTLTVGASERSTPRELIERWMAAPFHAAGLIDPQLRRTGFGVFRDRMSGGRFSEGATIDVLRGRSGRPASDVVLWPAQGMQVPITRYTGGEWPNPLTSCKGYKGSTGLPILAQFPDDVRITSSSFQSGGKALPHCVFDAHTYRNPDRSDRDHARAVLASRNTVVLIPEAPLADLRSYTASLTTSAGRTVTWTFSIGEVEPPTHPTVTGAVTSRAFQERTSFDLAWTATDHGSGAAIFDVRWRRASLTGRLGAYRTFVEDTAERRSSFRAEPGFTYCFSVRATDRAGNRSGWGAERCTTMPISARDLRASPLWLPAKAGDHYDGTAQLQYTAGATLSTGIVKARRIALIASRLPEGGTVDVLWNGRRLARLSLDAASLRNRDQIDVASFGRVRTGRVTVRVVSTNEPVLIEGLGVGRR